MRVCSTLLFYNIWIFGQQPLYRILLLILFLFENFYGYGSAVKEYKDSACVSSYYRAFLFLFFASARKFSHQTRSLRTKASKMRTLGVRAREKALNDHICSQLSTYLYQSDCNDTLEST